MQNLYRPGAIGILLSLMFAGTSVGASDKETSSIQYLGNEGVMVVHGEIKVLFDPIHNYPHDTYQQVPAEIEDAIYAARPPYDGIDSVFVSHFHADHFSAPGILRLLRGRKDIQLYAPAQAVAELRRLASDGDSGLFNRVTGFDMEYGDAPAFVRKSGILIEALHVPHSGWPTARTDVQNIVYRVTLEDASTVVHLGDADARLAHFDKDRSFWDERRVDLALPPYWFLLSDDGREILSDRIYAHHTIGIHVPAEYADNPSSMPGELQGEDLFMRPGEGRSFVGSQ